MDLQEIQNLIETFLKRIGISFESIEIIQEIEAHPIFFIRTSESHLLIGAGGEHLRAFNTLIKQIAWKSKDTPPPNFLIDVNGYHSRHIREVKKNAQVFAERVRMFKTPIEMSPMNAYDRMIVHSAFANDPVIKTESEGEGKFRHIVLKLK